MNSTATSPTRQRSTFRSIVAVVVGFVVVVVLSTATDAVMHATGVFPPMFQPMSDALFVLALAYRTAFTILGGYITALMAPAKPMKHAIVLGAIGMVVGTAGAVATWNKGPEFGPHWYALALIVLAIPSTWVGGKIREMQSGRRG